MFVRAVPAAVLIFVLSACGGGRHASSTLSASTTIAKNRERLTAAEYREKLNAICLTLYRTSLPGGRAARLSAIVKSESAAVASMRALNPPASLAGPHRRVVARIQAGLVRMSKLTREYESGTITWPQLAGRKWGPLISYQTRFWTKLGARVCARGHA
jgi:hypothetical protein